MSDYEGIIVNQEVGLRVKKVHECLLIACLMELLVMVQVATSQLTPSSIVDSIFGSPIQALKFRVIFSTPSI